MAKRERKLNTKKEEKVDRKVNQEIGESAVQKNAAVKLADL